MTVAHPSPCIRPAELADVDAVAEMHAKAYQETFDNMLPAEEVRRMQPSLLRDLWRRMLSARASDAMSGLHVATVGGLIVGLGGCLQQRSPELAAMEYEGEVAALYVLHEQHGRGFGRGLMQAMARQLHAAGCQTMALWSVRDNVRANAFYDRLGGQKVCEREDGCPDSPVPEIAWGWRDISVLM